MKTYREWLLENLNNGDIDIYWLNEMRRDGRRNEINNSDFETANQLSMLYPSNYEFQSLVLYSAVEYIDYLYFNR